MKNIIWVVMLLAIVSCQSEKSVEAVEIPIEGLPVAFDLMTPEIIGEYLPVGDKELKSHEAVIDKRDPKSDGRYWMWMPDEDIRDKEVDGFVQTNAHGVVYVKIQHDPDGGPNWAEKKLGMLNTRAGAPPPGMNVLSVVYEPVEGVGLEAYYANRASQIKFRVNDTHVITVSAEYPYSASKRKEIVKQLALEVIEKLQNLPEN